MKTRVYSCFAPKVREYYLDNSNPHQIQAVSGLSILKLNTAWLERNSSDSKLLRIGKHKLYLLFETLRSSPHNVKIAIGHHPFEAMHENDENDIMSMFHQFGVEIYLCGHVHKPFIQYNNYYDVLEIGCTSSAKSDSVSGGYILGTIDSDANCYKVEYYRWGNNRWYTAPDIVQTDDNGIYYFNTSSFTNSSKTVAVTFKTMQVNVTRKEIEKTLRTKSFEIVQYPCSIINTNDVNWAEHLGMVAEFAKQVISLREKEIFIFPLAHVPLLIAFGYELQRNSHYTIFQYARFQETWIYLNCDEINPKININYAASGNRILALSIAISTEINISDIQNAMADVDNYDLFSFDIDGPHIPGNPLNHNDVMVIARTIFEKVCPVANRYSDIHIFASVSAGLAIEIGRIIQQSIFPTIHLYNYDRSYKYCYSINEK